MKKFLMMIILCAVICCQKNDRKNEICVVCTTSIVKDLVENIGGKYVEVTALMGFGVDPHIYRATEGDVDIIYNADIIFYNGLSLEGKMNNILKSIGMYKNCISLGDNIDKKKLMQINDYKDSFDCHIWFDVNLWIDCAVIVEKNLSTIDGIHKNYYEQNLKNYIKKLENLHEENLLDVNKIPKDKRILVTSHDAFGYFGRSYGFNVVGLQGINTEISIGIKEIKQLTDFIIDKKIHCIFPETSVSEKGIVAVKEATKARGWKVNIGEELFSDSMENGQSYISMFRYNITTIINSLINYHE